MQTIEFDVSWNSDSEKIKAIRLLRTATGCGLKEAKYSVEAIQDVWGCWRFTPEQFGLFVAMRWQAEHGFTMADVRVLDGIQDDTVDFTKGPTWA